MYFLGGFSDMFGDLQRTGGGDFKTLVSVGWEVQICSVFGSRNNRGQTRNMEAFVTVASVC